MSTKKPVANPLSPAERTAKLLAFKGQTHNFLTGNKVPSKVIGRAVGAMRTI